jgi:hypothetical protein
MASDYQSSVLEAAQNGRRERSWAGAMQAVASVQGVGPPRAPPRSATPVHREAMPVETAREA